MALNLFNYDDPDAGVVKNEARILSDLTETEWLDFLAALERRSFPAGAEVLKAGEHDRVLYVIASGSVDVVIDSRRGRRIVAHIAAGSVFGEMAFFDGEPRSATIVAHEAVEVLALDQNKFAQLSAWRPRIAVKLLMDLGRILSMRLRRHIRSL
jgi:CRP-like cAMP-binding protein